VNERLPQHEPNKSPDDFPALSSGLKSLFAARMAPSAAAHEAVRAEIRRHFARTSAPPRSRISWRTLPWAIAAVILISVLSWMIWPGYQPNNQTPLLAYQPGDVDRNGRIDILDAMSLAGILEGGGPNQSEFDVNGDGTLDQRDVDFVAMQAVRLNVEAERKEAKS
jgi:hypothetical protein